MNLKIFNVLGSIFIQDAFNFKVFRSSLGSEPSELLPFMVKRLSIRYILWMICIPKCCSSYYVTVLERCTIWLLFNFTGLPSVVGGTRIGCWASKSCCSPTIFVMTPQSQRIVLHHRKTIKKPDPNSVNCVVQEVLQKIELMNVCSSAPDTWKCSMRRKISWITERLILQKINTWLSMFYMTMFDVEGRSLALIYLEKLSSTTDILRIRRPQALTTFHIELNEEGTVMRSVEATSSCITVRKIFIKVQYGSFTSGQALSARTWHDNSLCH